MKLVLASGSPRRKDLLNEAGIAFEVQPAAVDENEDWSLGIDELVSCNARLKCEAVADLRPDELVLGADTLVALDGRPLGKPADMEHAFQMLKTLVGNTHVVCTGVCLTHREAHRQVEFIERTFVTFRVLTDAQIHEYLGLINPLDKAGSYAAQDHGEFIIEKTEGSWTNVVGLPMEQLTKVLESFG
ncbi:MAG: Maf family protein [Verrucomicrobiota bacterium]